MFKLNLESVIKLVFIIFILFCIYLYFNKNEKFAEITLSPNGLPIEIMVNKTVDNKSITNTMLVSCQKIDDNLGTVEQKYEIKIINVADEKIKFDKLMEEYLELFKKDYEEKNKKEFPLKDSDEYKKLTNEFNEKILLKIPTFSYLNSLDVPYFTYEPFEKTLKIVHKMSLFDYMRGKTTNDSTKTKSLLFLSLNENTLDENSDIVLHISNENKIALEFIPNKKAMMTVGFYPSNKLLNKGSSLIPKKEYIQVNHKEYSLISRYLTKKLGDISKNMKPSCQKKPNENFFVCGIDGYNYVEQIAPDFKMSQITIKENDKPEKIVAKVANNVILENPTDPETEHKFKPLSFNDEQLALKIENKEIMFVGISDTKLILLNQLPN